MTPRPIFYALAIAALIHVARSSGVVADFWDAVRYPFEIDYGEGIVWQQAELFGTGRMYAPVTGFPFLVFHYPPLYYALVAAIRPVFDDGLAAGRAVSAMSSMGLATLVACIVVRASPPRAPLLLAGIAGLSVLCSGNVWTWGLLMRVDLVAIALSFLGLLIAHRSGGRFAPTAVALLACTAAVFTKQLQVSAGIAVFAVSFMQRPRSALLAAGCVGSAGLAGLAWLQWRTMGGFLHHIVDYNVNPLSLRYLAGVLQIESRDTLLLALGLVSAVQVWRRLPAWQNLITQTRSNPVTASRVLSLGHYGLCALTLLTAAKQGSNANYFIEFLASGGVLTGLAAVAWFQAGRWRWLGYQQAVLCVAALATPYREMPALERAQDSAAQWAVVARIRQAHGPVASENMTLLLRAGRPVEYEAAIVTQLANSGAWDQAPLLAMIRERRFAFMITIDDRLTPVSLRTPAVEATMRIAYPTAESVAPGIWINLPPAPDH